MLAMSVCVKKEQPLGCSFLLGVAQLANYSASEG